MAKKKGAKKKAPKAKKSQAQIAKDRAKKEEQKAKQEAEERAQREEEEKRIKAIKKKEIEKEKAKKKKEIEKEIAKRKKEIQKNISKPFKNARDILKFTLRRDFENQAVPFEGNEWIIPIFHMYMLRKHKNSCVIWGIKPNELIGLDKVAFMSFDTKSKSEVVGPPGRQKQVAVIGNVSVPSITGPGDEEANIIAFLKKMKRCKRNNFSALIPLTFPGHFNMIIYNVVRNTIERFEPIGNPPRGFLGIPDAIDNKLEALFRTKENGRQILDNFTYVSSQEVCPDVGPQEVEKYLPKEEGAFRGIVVEDSGGFCAAWSFFYADIRLSFPGREPNELLDDMLRIFERSDIKFRRFIRGFSQFFLEIFDEFSDELTISMRSLGFPSFTAVDAFKELRNIHVTRIGLILVTFFTDKLVQFGGSRESQLGVLEDVRKRRTEEPEEEKKEQAAQKSGRGKKQKKKKKKSKGPKI